jgi:poly-gamma-glutamate synthesis protein (capsule biosynthesis protein)
MMNFVKRLMETGLMLMLMLMLSVTASPSLAQGQGQGQVQSPFQPQIPKEDLHLVFVGDIMLDGLPGRWIERGHDPFAGFSSVLTQSDLTIGNFESALGNTGHAENKPYVFRAKARVLPWVKKYFHAISLANNHTGDYGPEGLSQAIDWMDAMGLAHFGAGKEIRAAHEPFVFDVKGKRIAVLGYDLFLPRSFEALDDRAGTAWGEREYISADIRRAKEFYHADVVMIYPHWGWEGEKTASGAQVELAHWMIDQGADAVVGGHPHVTQNIEVYKGKPIFYSLGNFVFDGFHDPDTTTGWVLKLTLQVDGQWRWETLTARLDRNGIPHPEKTRKNF